jgi:hypothetical protein
VFIAREDVSLWLYHGSWSRIENIPQTLICRAIDLGRIENHERMAKKIKVFFHLLDDFLSAERGFDERVNLLELLRGQLSKRNGQVIGYCPLRSQHIRVGEFLEGIRIRKHRYGHFCVTDKQSCTAARGLPSRAARGKANCWASASILSARCWVGDFLNLR